LLAIAAGAAVEVTGGVEQRGNVLCPLEPDGRGLAGLELAVLRVDAYGVAGGWQTG
jgi:hypothetical protein